MFINTHSRKSMENSMCQIFQMAPEELKAEMEAIGSIVVGHNNHASHENYISKLNSFIAQHVANFPDEIQLFHLTRRLYGTEDEIEGRNLADLLLSDNSFSSFFKCHDIEFIEGDQHIDVIYRGKTVDLEKIDDSYATSMVKRRLGYDKVVKDFCFNGFAMKKTIFDGPYRELISGPEFLLRLTECLRCQDIAQEFRKNSDCYYYEYLLPLADVIFDGYDKYSYESKQLYLTRLVLQDLYQSQTTSFGNSCYGYELILRLPDDYTVPAEYYIGREKIEPEMLY